MKHYASFLYIIRGRPLSRAWKNNPFITNKNFLVTPLNRQHVLPILLPSGVCCK